MPEKGQLMGLRRGVRVLELLSRDRNGFSFSDLQEETHDMPAPTMSRLLKVLIDMELVCKESSTGHYQLAEGAILLAKKLMGTVPREEIIKPVLEALASRTNESAAYFEVDGRNMILKAKSEVPESFHYMAVYGRNTQFPHAFLQACMAFMDESAHPAYFEHGGRSDFIGKREWKRRMQEARQAKLYIDDCDSHPGAMRMAAPVFLGEKGEVVGSIGVCLLKGRATDEAIDRCKELVRLAGEQATEKLAEYGYEDLPEAE